MSLTSMTGFARSSGATPPIRWIWELKAVNAKGLDLRLRLPAGFESLEPEVRARIAKRVTRGACHANLSVQRDAQAPEVRVNRAAAAAILEALRSVEGSEFLAPLSFDGLLAARGVVEFVETEEGDREAHEAKILAGLDGALADLVGTRRAEGAALTAVLATRLATLARLVESAAQAPGRKPDQVRSRLARMVDELAGRSNVLDPSRLHQEALLLAAKADVTEEIDRLRTHVAAAQSLMQSQEPVGRRLDFLAQELGREANTLCAKSSDAGLTTIGIEMRVEIEQFREQVQNIE